MAILIVAICLPRVGTALDLEQFQTQFPEYGLVDGPDGRYLTRQSGKWGKGSKQQIWFYPDGQQAAVVPAWASPEADESDFYYSAALSKACFVSNRDTPAAAHHGDIWCLDWTDQGWSEPRRLPDPLNSAAEEYSPVLAANGDLYFASDRPGGLGMGDLYVATRDKSSWRVTNLGDQVNTEGGEWNLELSPDGKQLIFEASHRASNISVAGDLYLSELRDGEWSKGRSLNKLNSRGSDLMLRFLASGEIVYAQSQEGDVTLLQVTPQDLR
ncbi:MAG: hypothetical protein AAF431_13760 [Pseudomonadota bacterium]